MIDNFLTLLQANSHVDVDMAGLIWSYPLKHVNRYLERIGIPVSKTMPIT